MCVCDVPSRLERLWILLDQGSTPVLRKTAAEQIGDIIAWQPGELEHLINTVRLRTVVNSKFDYRKTII